MGIHYLTKFIKEMCPYALTKSDVTNFKYTKIAIDTPIVMFKFKHLHSQNPNTNMWLTSFIVLIHFLRSHDIHPVFVLEGKYPLEKTETRNKRRKSRKDFKEKTRMLEAEIKCEVSESIQVEWNKIMKKQNPDFDDIPYHKETMVDIINLRHRYDVSITKEDYKLLNLLLRILKVPCIQAPYEAEALCAYLESVELVDFVFSADSDVLCYGCSKVITKIDTYHDQIWYIDNDQVKESLDFNDAQFLDFCILAGTDYNETIPRVGIKTGYNLIHIFKSIENITRYNTDCLNYKRVRELFTSYGFANTPGETGNWFEPVPYCGIPYMRLLGRFIEIFDLGLEVESLTSGFVDCSSKLDVTSK